MSNIKFDIASQNGNFKLDYKTTTGKIYPLEIGYALFSSKLVPVDQISTIEACRNGCRLYGRNGGCPPFSPNFSKISRSNFLILYAKMLTKYYPPKVLNGAYYIRWVFVETFMTALTNRVGRRLAKILSGYFISSGHCSACRPKRCAVKDGKKCRNPSERTYSLESTGVLVTKLMEDCFDIELQWWRKEDPSYIPSFMVKVVGVTMDKSYNSAVILEAIRKAIKKDRVIIFDNYIEL